MYAAIAHQLQVQGMTPTKDYYKVLRQLASTYMLEHEDQFMPFIESSNGETITQGFIIFFFFLIAFKLTS